MVGNFTNLTIDGKQHLQSGAAMISKTKIYKRLLAIILLCVSLFSLFSCTEQKVEGTKPFSDLEAKYVSLVETRSVNERYLLTDDEIEELTAILHNIVIYEPYEPEEELLGYTHPMFTVIKKDGTAFWIGEYCDGVIDFNSTLYRAKQAPLDDLSAFYHKLIMQINVDKKQSN